MSAYYEELSAEELVKVLRWGSNEGDHLIRATAEAVARILERPTPTKVENHHHYPRREPLFTPNKTTGPRTLRPH